ncbi:MAG: carboxymuconolactone decarboxylase family protein [Planctomycetes bacterium]|nr:carboxymuconolactone decarboxylase family protein [Planctomycetota bacterium]MBL7007643.1 carboxymuconolactone decarboxylase family protein [Planctomycetota bacterium]
MDRFDRIVALAAAVDRRQDAAIGAAAAALVAHEGPEAVRELLRQVHLFRGFPRVVHALNVVAPLLPAADAADAADGPDPAPEAGKACGVAGEALFRDLYGEDADKVLPHLRRLDPVFSAWVLDHAYGRVMQRQVLPLAERERLAVLLLAADGCWQQWRSHARICRRLGIPTRTLAEDAGRSGWLDQEQLQRARQGLAGLDEDPPPGDQGA